jgi:hypothetical protein
MGLLLFVALVIFAIVTTTDVDNDIANRVDGLVGKIGKGENPNE